MTESRRQPIGQILVDRLAQPQFILALLSGALLWWLAYRLLGRGVPSETRELVAALVGFISGQMVGPAWQFFLGTTQASEKKTTALADNAAQLRRAGETDGEPKPVVVTNLPDDPIPVSDTATESPNP
jgi:hypothetical protein